MAAGSVGLPPGRADADLLQGLHWGGCIVPRGLGRAGVGGLSLFFMV